MPSPASVTRSALPPNAFLGKYVGAGAYADCYATEIAAKVEFTDYVKAFLTSPVFKMERFVLWFIAKPSSDEDARRLAEEETGGFAAWRVEARAPDRLLLCDFLGRTRSWLMAAPIADGVRLYFGTAIVPVGMGSARGRLGFPFNALLGFHDLYSRTLLGAARSQLIGRVSRLEGGLSRR